MTDFGIIPGGFVGASRAYQDRFRELVSPRSHTRRDGLRVNIDQRNVRGRELATFD